MKLTFEGAFTAQITPFDKDDNLDEEGFRRNIRSQIEGGIDGLVPSGPRASARRFPTRNTKRSSRSRWTRRTVTCLS